MRRSLAVVLATVVSLLLILPAFLGTGEAALPACCRKAGKHHCMQMASESSGVSFSAIREKCPAYPHSSLLEKLQIFNPSLRQAVIAGSVTTPSAANQAEAGYRISHFRSRQKRGPPSFSFVLA